MVDHQTGHAAIDADVLACDETCLVGAKEEHHVGDVEGIADTSCGLLNGIGTLIDGVGGVDPSRGDGVDAHLSGKTDCQGMGQCGNATFGCRVAFGLRLAHAVA